MAPPPPTTVTAQRASAAASVMEAHGHLSPLAHLALGPLLQCTEAATLGLPFEVWKTRQGRFRSEGALTAARNVWAHGGGLGAFWSGFTPKVRLKVSDRLS